MLIIKSNKFVSHKISTNITNVHNKTFGTIIIFWSKENNKNKIDEIKKSISIFFNFKI